MNRICVVTSKAGAYYALVSRLRRAGLSFSSIVPGSDCRECGLILTTVGEAGPYGSKAVTLEDLDEDPSVFKGQIVSKLDEGDEIVFVGIDPGKRTGLAVFYGETGLAFNTFDSSDALCSRVGEFVRGLPRSRFIIRIGNGNANMAARLAEALARLLPQASIEIVDEAGTSIRTSRMKGVQGDQRAAAKIAFRRGEAFKPGLPRIRE